MFTPTKEQLEELGFKHSWNIRKPHEWFIVTDSVRIRYFYNSWILETTEFSLIPTLRAYQPQSIEDIQTIIRLLSPNN